MMEKAGYLQRTGCRAVDSEGMLHEVVDLHICGERFAIRRSDLVRAVSGSVAVQVEELTHHYAYYLGITRGLAQISQSGKALNIDLFNAGSFTISLVTLRAILFGKERTAPVARIPEQSGFKFRRVAGGQRTIGAIV
jgi:hypothetical protein